MLKTWISVCFLLVALFAINTKGAFGQTLEDFAVEPSVQAAAMSPDGGVLAIGVAHKEQQQIKLTTLNGLNPVDSVSVDIDFIRNSREDIHWLGWAGENDLLAFVTFVDAGLKGKPIGTGRLVRVSRDGSEYKDLGLFYGVNLRGNRERLNAGGLVSLLPDHPEHVLMSVGQYGVSRLNIRTGHSELIRRGSLRGYAFTVDLRGEPRVSQSRLVEPVRYHLSIRDADSTEWRDFSEYPGLAADERIVGFTSDPNELIIARYGQHDTMEFLVYDLSSKSISRTLYSDARYDAESLVYDSLYQRVIGVEYVANTRLTRFLKANDAEKFERMNTLFPNSIVTLMSQDYSGDKQVYRITASNKAGIVALYDHSTREHKLIAADYPGLMNSEMGQVQSITYQAEDGTNIPAYLTLPSSVSADSAQNMPLIVLPHGGPYAREDADFDWLSQFLSYKGYAVLKMNFRGSTGFGKSFLDAGRNDWSLMRSDVFDGAKWAVESGLANPDRVCIVGWSFGGFIAQMAAAEASDLFACAASINGVSSFTHLPFSDAEDEEFWGSLNRNDKLQIQQSPISHVADMEIPVFLAHGSLDQTVAIKQYDMMRRKLKKEKVEHVGLKLKGANHQIDSFDHRLRLLEELDVFLASHLGESEWALD